LEEDIGDIFNKKTILARNDVKLRDLDWTIKPETYKTYKEKPKLKLPSPTFIDSPSIWEILSKRRSRRNFTPNKISIENISLLLWATQGITSFIEGYGLRTAPSAGALYPIETYLIVNRSLEIEPGIYHYYIPLHSLELMESGNFEKNISSASLNQTIAETADLVFTWTARIERSKWKYLQRSYRYVYIEAGHIAQNLALAAESLSLGCCNIGAFYDEEINHILGIDGKKEFIIYMACVGFV
jgi:SagB-type dehydrogenase family enzyme